MAKVAAMPEPSSHLSTSFLSPIEDYPQIVHASMSVINIGDLMGSGSMNSKWASQHPQFMCGFDYDAGDGDGRSYSDVGIGLMYFAGCNTNWWQAQSATYLGYDTHGNDIDPSDLNWFCA